MIEDIGVIFYDCWFSNFCVVTRAEQTFLWFTCKRGMWNTGCSIAIFLSTAIACIMYKHSCIDMNIILSQSSM